jgi:hypothetical protein
MKRLRPLLVVPALLILLAACDDERAAPAADRNDGRPAAPAVPGPPADAGTAADDAVAAPLPAAVAPGDGVIAADGTRPAVPARLASTDIARIQQQAPPVIRGIYLNAYALSRTRLGRLLELAEATELNTFVVDVKTERGVHYPSQLPLARQLTQEGEVTLRNPQALADTLRARGIWSVARIVVFKDELLSAAKPEWSIRTADGGLWRDRQGLTWVSAWEPGVWDYNIAIAEEIARAGFDEIQFDYVRFPEPFRSLPPQVHPKQAGDRTDAIVAFLTEARRRLHPLGTVVGADVFGLAPVAHHDVDIGQQWERISMAADHILPMVYPSHFLPTHLRNVPRPNRMPYETVFQSMGMGALRTERLAAGARAADGGQPARIITWLQAFNAPWVDRDFPYGAAEAEAQIQALYDAGLEDWIFWHPGSRYDPVRDAFAPRAEPRARRTAGFDAIPALVDAIERQIAPVRQQAVGAGAAAQ